MSRPVAPSLLITSRPSNAPQPPLQAGIAAAQEVSQRGRTCSHQLRVRPPNSVMDHQVGFEALRDDCRGPSPFSSVSAGRICLQLASTLPEQRELRDVGRLLAQLACPLAIRRPFDTPWRRPTRPLAHPLQPLGTIWRLYRSSHISTSSCCGLCRTALSSSKGIATRDLAGLRAGASEPEQLERACTALRNDNPTQS